MIDQTTLLQIADEFVSNCIEDSDYTIADWAEKYILQLEQANIDANDWIRFNYFLNTKINKYENISFSKNIFIDTYSLMFNYFQDKIGPIQSITLSNIDNISNIFQDENIVTEAVWGARVLNNLLVQGPPINTTEIIEEFKGLEDATYLLSRKTFLDLGKDDASDNVEDMPSEIIEISEENSEEKQDDNQIKERTTSHVLTATLNIKSKLNEFGLAVLNGSVCPVCGKRVKFIPSNGYCSLLCAGIAIARKAQESLSGEYLSVNEKVQKKIDLVKEILNYINLSLNLFAKIPDVLAGIARLPEEYKNYAILKINIIFLEIKQLINKLLILKNKIIISLLKRIKFGTIDDKVKLIIPSINNIIQLMNKLKQALNEALNTAYMAILKANGLFYIGPLEYGFFMTAKSFQCICPYFKTDVNTYPPELLGRPYWGPGIFNIAFDMSKCLLTVDIGAKSALLNRDFKKINNIIKKIFLPILEVEYLMDPDLFDVRLALSDLNATSIQKMINMLLDVVVLGGDFIPSYDKLNLTNIWYIVAILTCWGPWTQKIYGDYIFHGMI